MSQKELLRVEHLKKYFQTPRGTLSAVEDVSFRIEERQTLGVVGESGCGKSTLGRCILRLHEPTGGKVIFNGENILEYDKVRLKRLRSDMQIIFQDPYASLNPRMTVSQAIAAPLLIQGVYTAKEKDKIQKKVLEMMDVVGLARRLINSYPHELDGGRRQRIGIARALALNPKFIVCDEPVSALDVSIQAQVLNLLMRLKEELKLTYIFITHNLSVVEYISDRIAVMYLGRIVELASTEQIFENTMHPYTEALLSAIPVVDPDNKRSRIVLEGDVPNPVHPPEGCHFHPRCKNCMDICMHKKPELKRHMINGEEHFCACHLYDQTPAGGSDD